MARKDKRAWLCDLIGSGAWDALKQIRKPPKPCQGRLRGANGDLVDSNERAGVFARYLQDVQWHRRDSCLVQGPPLKHLDVFLGDISLVELLNAVKRMKKNKASGPDAHPLEFWYVVLNQARGSSLEGAQFLVDYCNAIWHQASVPTAWHLQRVALIYKKGDPAECSNYRPICLLNAAYKYLLWYSFNDFYERGQMGL